MSSEEDHNPFASAAREYLERGWKIIELHRLDPSGRHCTCSGKSCSSEGKHPTDAGWSKRPGLTARQVDRLWAPSNLYNANIGIATGEPSGIWVLDVDPDHGGAEALRKMQADNGPLSPGFAVRTGSGGWHLYFSMPDFPVTNSRGRLARKYGKGLDVRGTGGQVVAPPSRSLKGDYAVIKNGPVGPAPDWLLDLIRPEDRPPLVAVPAPAPDAPTDDQTPTPATTPAPADPRLATYAQRAWDGELGRLDELKAKGWDGPPWDETTYQVACNLIELANSDWTPFAIEDAYQALFTRAPRDPGFADDRVNAKFESARERVQGKARPQPRLTPLPSSTGAGDPLAGVDVTVDPRLTGAVPTTPGTAPVDPTWPMRTQDDMGNALRLQDHFGASLRYLVDVAKWAYYNGSRWEILDEVRFLVHQMLDRLPTTEALAYSPVPEHEEDKTDPRTRFMKWVKMQRMTQRITACLKEASALDALRAVRDDFDREPMLLNVRNGVVDLRTGALLPARPEMLLMQQASIEYDPDATAPLWEAFLERVQPDPAMRTYLQRLTGYSITGNTNEQVMFLHHGTGANGKSVYLRAVSMVLGDYDQTVPRSTLLVKSNGESHPTDIARMVGKRFLQVSETGVGRRLDEEVVKGLTGQEKQTGRFMHGNFFDFTPTGKIHYVTNHLPRLSDAESIWRRMHLVAWRVTIPPHEMDPNLGDKLEAEAQGIFAWMVRGASDWWRNRLGQPESAIADVRAYRKDQDIFGQFIASRLDRVDSTHFTNSDALFQAYSAWAFSQGIRKTLHAMDFARAMIERGFEQVDALDGTRGFRGVRPRPYPGQQQDATSIVPNDASSITESGAGF